MSSKSGVFRNTNLSAIFLTLGFAMACYPAGGSSAQPPSALIMGGTYQVSVCEEPCVPGNPTASGFVVLTDGPIVVGPLSEAGRRYMERDAGTLLLMLGEFDREPNACFGLEAHSNQAASIGVTPAAVTGWYRADGGISILIWVTPDAGYEARLLADGVDWKGRGYAWYTGKGYHATTEAVTLTRIGPPDVGRCVRAIEEAAARRYPAASSR